MIENGMTLRKIEMLLEERIKNCDIISDLNLTREEYEYLREKIESVIMVATKSNIRSETIESFHLAISTYLVYTAIYYYNGDFWSTVEELMKASGYNIRTLLGETFLRTTYKYDLKEFREGGHKYVTPIICHAGLPNFSLSGIFELIYPTIDDTEFSPQYMIDELRYFAQYKVDKTVYRFISNNDDKAAEVFQNIREFIIASEKYGYNPEQLYTSFNYIDKRFIDSFLKWKENKTVYTKIAKRRKYSLVSPKIKIDSGGIGVYLFLPKQTVRSHYDNSLEWIISYEEKEEKNSVKVKLLYSGEDLVSEEKSVRLKEAKTYTINLYYTDELIGNWQFEGINKETPFMIFDERDNLIKTQYIATQGATIVYNSGLKLEGNFMSSMDLPALSGGWSGKKVTYFKLEDKATGIKLTSLFNEGDYEIEYRRSNTICLYGGKYLFNELPKEEEIPIYSGELPKIKIECGSEILKQHIMKEYKLVIKNKEFNTSSEALIKDFDYDYRNGQITVKLSGVILKENSFGEFEIRVIDGKSIKKFFIIRLVPEILTRSDSSGMWPGEKGYERTFFMFSAPENVTIEFDDIVTKANDTYSGRKYIKVFTDTVNEHMSGKLSVKYGGKELNYLVKKRIRALQWAWWQDKDDNINWQKSTRRLFIDELQQGEGLYLLLKANSLEGDAQEVKLSLKNVAGSILQTKNYKLIQNKSIRVSMEEFLLTIGANSDFRLYLIIDLLNEKREKVATLTAATIQERIYIKSLIYQPIDSETMKITWEQQGNITDKCLKVINISRPWEEPITLDINDLNIEKYSIRYGVNVNREQLGITEPGLYSLQIDEQSDSFFEEIEFSVPKLRKGTYLSFEVDSIDSDTLPAGISAEDTLTILIACFEKGSIKYLFSQLAKVNFKVDRNNARKVAVGIYTIYVNLNFIKGKIPEEVFKYYKGTYIKLVNECCSGKGKYLILKEFIRFNLKGQEFRRLVDYLKFNDLPVIEEGILSNSDKEYLWMNYGFIGFINEMRNSKKDRNLHINGICNWLEEGTIENILPIRGTCREDSSLNSKECLKGFIAATCDCTKRNFNSSQKLIGSLDDYGKIFTRISSLKALNLDHINWMKDFEDDGIKIFGKSYVRTIYEWNTSENNTHNKDEIKKLFTETREGITNIYNRVKNMNIVEDLAKLLRKRKNIGDTGINNTFYHIGLTILLKTLGVHGFINIEGVKRDYQHINKAYNGFYKYFNELFTRDSILMEFYIAHLRNEGNSNVNESNFNHSLYKR